MTDGTWVTFVLMRGFMLQQVTFVDGPKTALLALVQLTSVFPCVGVQITCRNQSVLVKRADRPKQCV